MTVVTLNGQPHELCGPATVEDAVLAAGAPDGRGVAVALDGEVVPRGEWATTEVRDGQQVEVLRAVQGGS
jgi:sulfur carrier protein